MADVELRRMGEEYDRRRSAKLCCFICDDEAGVTQGDFSEGTEVLDQQKSATWLLALRMQFPIPRAGQPS